MTNPVLAPPAEPSIAPVVPPPLTPPPRPRASLAGRLRAGAHPLAVLVLLAAGAATWWAMGAAAAERVWLVALVATGAPVVWRTVVGIARRQFAADIVASLAIVTAVLVGEPLAGLIVVLMQTGGEALERYAGERASDAVRALEAAAPTTAWRVEEGGVRAIPVEQAVVGDVLLVRPGELVPCDVEVTDGSSHVDLSALTGEPVPIHARAGTALPSGAGNVDGPLTVRVVRPARESRYARIVELVRSAQESKAPLQRLADRYAVWFTPATLVVAAAAWALSGDTSRVLAVLVVATPCPLILATPVAVIGGINRAARRHIVVRHGVALEQVGAITTVVFDKTGTLTLGAPEVRSVEAVDGYVPAELLRLAAAVERGSGHPLAAPVVAHAEDEGVGDAVATEVREVAGQGVQGRVEGRLVLVGARAWVEGAASLPPSALAAVAGEEAGLRAFVVVDGRAAGAIVYADRTRAEVRELLARLHALGVHDLHLMSGDDPRNVRALAESLGMPSAEGGLYPDDKVRVVRDLLARGRRVAMVGDGTNDAPALAAATVGIALGGHGGGISTEAADVVLLADDVRGVADVMAISRRTMRIARQSIWAGLGLSSVAMLFAAAGLVPPTLGALLQEAIDVAVILNALRTSRG